MSNEPRNHHYVPQFYLAGFTKDGTIDGTLHVVDKTRLKRWDSNPRRVAYGKDFHKIAGGPETDPMIVEKLLGQIEGKWSSVLRDVLERRSVPADDTFGDLMMFVAFLAVRVPRIRETISTFIDDVHEKEEFARKCLEQQGHQIQPASDNTFDQFDQTWHVQQMLQMGIQLAPLLSLRKWCLWHVKDDAPDLICSDNPIAPTYLISPPGPIPPSFGTPNTIVSVPLNRGLALVSLLEEEIGQMELDREGVAVVNSMTAMYATQFYSVQEDFVWLTKDHRVGTVSDLLAAIRNEKQRNPVD